MWGRALAERPESIMLGTELEEAALRNQLINKEARRIFEKLLECFKSAAAKVKVAGVVLAFQRPELDLGHMTVTVERRGLPPVRSTVNIELDLPLQEIRCSTFPMGGTETLHFTVAAGTVGLSYEGLPIRKLDAACEMILGPILSAARALR